MRAAALGSEELMRTGWEISILCLLLSWAALWLTDSAENECLFLAFFFPSPRRWPEPFPLDGEAQGEGPGAQEPNGAGSELGPGALVGVGLSISISCLAVSFNCEERGREEEVRVLALSPRWCTSMTTSRGEVCLCGLFFSFSLAAFHTSSITIITYNNQSSETHSV